MAITQNGVLKRDDNDTPVMGGTSSSDNATIINASFDPITRRLLTDAASGSGTVTDVSVVTANGFAGTVANSTTTPAITLTTTITGILSGNGTAISAASTTGTGAVVLANSPTFIDDITLGVQAGATGSILFKGLTAGTVTMKVADTAGTWTLTLPTDDGTSGQVLTTDGNGVTSWATNGAGDVVGPASATDNAIVRFDGTTGKLIQNSAITVTDVSSGEVDITTTQNFMYMIVSGNGAVGSIGTGDGTYVEHVAADGVANDGGDVRLTAGDATANNKNGGNAIVNLGAKNGSGVAGTMKISDNVGGGKYAVLQTASIATSDKTFTFPNTTGTFALVANPTTLTPLTNDLAALGTNTVSWSDLFLASGAVINFANGNVALTHTSGILTMGAGELRITSANVGTNADSVPTLSSTSTMTNKTLTAPTLGGATSLADGATLKLIVPTVDGTATGPTTAAFVSGYTSSAVGDLVYLDSNGKWQKTDADAIATTTGLLGIALAVAATDAALLVALPGSIVYATAFPTMTIGVPMYVDDTTAGAIKATIPTGADNCIRVVGFAVHADKLFFLPSSDNQTTVA